MKFILVLCLINLSSICWARVPPRNQETAEETAPVADKPKEDTPIATPVERSPIDSSSNDELTPLNKPTFARKPVLILFRQQPSISLFANRSPNPFSSGFQPSLLDHSHFPFHRSSFHDDPAIRLISLLLGDRRLRPVQPESTAETETVNTSAESGESSEDNRRDVHPFESLFPSIFPIPRFPLDDETEKEGEASSSNEEKTPANFENKEKKVVNIGGRKFVKTTQIKKVKNDFGQFHSVISSYQPFDEKIHDENGNEKIKPEESEDKVSPIDKKDVESSTTVTEKTLSSSTPSDDKTDDKVDEKIDDKVDFQNVSSPSTPSPEKEEATQSSDLKPVTPDQSEKLRLVPSVENLSKEQDDSKNEIPDKNNEIKVDQMN